MIATPRILAQSGQPASILTGDALPILTNIVIAGQYEHDGAASQLRQRRRQPANPAARQLRRLRYLAHLLGSFERHGLHHRKDIPQISQRTASTIATVRDGQAIVIGGLLQDNEIRNLSAPAVHQRHSRSSVRSSSTSARRRRRLTCTSSSRRTSCPWAARRRRRRSAFRSTAPRPCRRVTPPPAPKTPTPSQHRSASAQPLSDGDDRRAARAHDEFAVGRRCARARRTDVARLAVGCGDHARVHGGERVSRLESRADVRVIDSGGRHLDGGTAWRSATRASMKTTSCRPSPLRPVRYRRSSSCCRAWSWSAGGPAFRSGKRSACARSAASSASCTRFRCAGRSSCSRICPYPEGVAAAEVLRVGAGSRDGTARHGWPDRRSSRRKQGRPAGRRGRIARIGGVRGDRGGARLRGRSGRLFSRRCGRDRLRRIALVRVARRGASRRSLGRSRDVRGADHRLGYRDARPDRASSDGRTGRRRRDCRLGAPSSLHRRRRDRHLGDLDACSNSRNPSGAACCRRSRRRAMRARPAPRALPRTERDMPIGIVTAISLVLLLPLARAVRRVSAGRRAAAD